MIPLKLKIFLNLFLIKCFEIESALALADQTRSKYSIENITTDIVSKITKIPSYVSLQSAVPMT